MDGTWGKIGTLSLAKDGTTAYRSVANDWYFVNEKKAKEYAITNTYEMLDLLYGSRSAEANNDLLNSDFYKGLGNFTRADQVGSQVRRINTGGNK